MVKSFLLMLIKVYVDKLWLISFKLRNYRYKYLMDWGSKIIPVNLWESIWDEGALLNVEYSLQVIS